MRQHGADRAAERRARPLRAIERKQLPFANDRDQDKPARGQKGGRHAAGLTRKELRRELVKLADGIFDRTAATAEAEGRYCECASRGNADATCGYSNNGDRDRDRSACGDTRDGIALARVG